MWFARQLKINSQATALAADLFPNQAVLGGLLQVGLRTRIAYLGGVGSTICLVLPL